MIDNKIAISVTEAASMLNISRMTLYRLMKQADFPSYKIGNRTVIDLQGLKEWSRKQAGDNHRCF